MNDNTRLREAEWNKPCQMYSQCCGKPLNGDDLESGRCPDCREFCTPVEFNDAPEEKPEGIFDAMGLSEGTKVINKVFNDINKIFEEAKR